MAPSLQGMRIALLTADGVGQLELDTATEVVEQAGAQTQLLSLTSGQVKSLAGDLGRGRTYVVDRTVAQATADEYDALLLVPGRVKPDALSSDDIVVSFVCDFITSGKPIGVVCHGAWTLLEAGVARGRSLSSFPAIGALRQTGASILDGEPVAPQELRAFYSSIVEEFARLAPAVPRTSAEEIDQFRARLTVLPARRHSVNVGAAMGVADSSQASTRTVSM